MRHRSRFTPLRLALVTVAAFLLLPGTAQAHPITDYAFTGPNFGMAPVPGDGLAVADAGAGVVKLQGGVGSLFAALPGVSDVAPVSRHRMHAITGAPDAMLYWLDHGHVTARANLGAFEAAVNPDGGEVDSNPFGVARLRHFRALVADAGGNSVLVVGKHGWIDWVATLPEEIVPTANAKRLAGCPAGPVDICGLPAQIPAQPVATSVAVGPDGAYYVSELKGFPGPRNHSRIWRIEPGARHVHCGSSPKCTVVARGFTSIVDLSFDRHGNAYVVEIDENSFMVFEGPFGPPAGGTVNRCDGWTWHCTAIATNLPIPTAAAVQHGQVFVAINSLIPGEATVIRL
ncbi:MAG: ScyD/ScyE family protein [Actinomycetota bacterium]